MRLLINTMAPLQQWFLDSLAKIGECKRIDKLDDDNRQDFLGSAEVMVCSGGSRAPETLIDEMPNLKIIAVYGTGYDGVDVKHCKARGIIVTNTPAVMKDDVADTAVALLLNIAREFPGAHKHVVTGGWLNGPCPLTTRVTNMRVGIAGMGAIGQEIASRLKNGFRCEIGYYARHQNTALPYTFYSSIKDLALWAQALILVLPGGKATFHLVDEEVLKALGRDGFLVNVGRGSLVDTKALIKVLANKELKGCGLDVFEREPVLPYELLKHENVCVLPHVGSATFESRDAMAHLVLENIESFLNNGQAVTAVPELA